MSKEYEYNGKIYSDENLSKAIDNYGGTLYDLTTELRKEGMCKRLTVYAIGDFTEYDLAVTVNRNHEEIKLYADYEDMLDDYYCWLEV
ncbi:MAG: hypothetical protein LUI05_02185 [Oscillospiraceae bacterium]|nr:hypothetical protein [Oscillospiraceae bacterium]